MSNTGDNRVSEPTVTADAIRLEYDTLARTCDKQFATWLYDVPQRAVVLLAEYAPRSSRVLDAGCGTGLSGRALWESGYTEVDGLDISPACLRVARFKEIYRGLIKSDLSSPLPLIDDDYDAVLCTGVLEHTPTIDVLRELCRITRKGGIIVFSQRDDMAERYGFADQLATLQDAGLWEPLHTSKSVAYMHGHPDYKAANVTARFYAFRVR